MNPLAPPTPAAHFVVALGSIHRNYVDICPVPGQRNFPIYRRFSKFRAKSPLVRDVQEGNCNGFPARTGCQNDAVGLRDEA
jgi:hypothetical protein